MLTKAYFEIIIVFGIVCIIRGLAYTVLASQPDIFESSFRLCQVGDTAESTAVRNSSGINSS